MAMRTVEMEPADALAGVVSAMAEAGRYAGQGTRTSGRRAGRRARVIGTEAARRAALAARALGGARPPARRSRIGMIVVVAGATAAGAAAALAAHRVVTLIRNRDAGDATPSTNTPPTDTQKLGADTPVETPAR
jgi:hypothetical protein